MKCAAVALTAIMLTMPQICAAAESAQETNRGAVEELQRLRELLSQSPGPVKRNTLDAIARTAWQALFRVLHKGLREAQGDIEALIAVRKTLEQRPGLPENLLALRLQQAVDAALLHEVIREHEHRTGVSFYTPLPKGAPKTSSIPFVPGSVSPDVIGTLLGANRLDEAERVRYALGLDNRFAEAFKKAGASVSSILEGGFAFRKETDDRDLEQYYRHSAEYFFPRERTREGLSDYVFVSTLKTIDYARFARIAGSLYLEKGGKLHHAQEDLKIAVAERIANYPAQRKREVRTGKEFGAEEVVDITLRNAGRPGHFYLMASLYLQPFLSDLSSFGEFPDEKSRGAVLEFYRLGWCLEFAPE